MPVIDLTNLTATQGFRIIGDTAGDYAGYSVAGAGDVNGDGIDDFIVGARYGSLGGLYAGQAYVIYGKTGATRPAIDLTNLTAADGFRIVGAVPNDQAGYAVARAGDINGDGIGDLLIGAPRNNDGGTSYAGAAYVVYGKVGATRGTVNLSTLAASDGYVIQGDTVGDFAGRSLSTAGDVNGDGITDFIVGATKNDAGAYDGGSAYVIFGRTGVSRGRIDLTSLPAADGYRISTSTANNAVGLSVSGGGDVNGDGISDLIVGVGGSPLYGPNFNGRAYVIYGTTTPTHANVVLDTMPTSAGFMMQGAASGDVTGRAVSYAGDVNGDGFGDILVSAFFADSNGVNSGSVYVVYGQSGATRGTLDLATLAAANGFLIRGAAAQDQAGSSAAYAGDVNGDGYDDIIIGAPGNDDGGASAGAAYVIFGAPGNARGTITLSPALAASDGFVIQGDVAGDLAGRRVAAAGDINRDGTEDIIIGADRLDAGGTDAGGAYVLYGVPTYPGSTRGNDTLTNAPASGAINGLQGIDTLDMSGFTSVITLNTVTGTMSSTQGGNDTVANVERFLLGSGNDIVTFGNAGYGIQAGGGNDTITGGTGRDSIGGGDGDDTLTGGSGAANELAGGAGNDTYTVSAIGDSIIELVNQGTDEVRTINRFFTLAANVENLTFTDNTLHNGVGNASDNILIGNTGRDELQGLGGNDTLNDGGSTAGNEDTLIGGTGNDTYIVSLSGDSVVELTGEGTDEVRTGVSAYFLPTNVENLTFTNNIAHAGIGNAGDNVMTGGTGADELQGGNGNDTLIGGSGADLLIGGAGADIFRYNGGETGYDRILDFAAGTDKIALNAAFFARTPTLAFIATGAPVATSANSTFLYDVNTGILSYDADGNGAGAAVQLAQLNTGLTLTTGDFIFV